MKNKIIESLKDCQGYLSGEDVSRDLNISRAAIWKNIEELRKEGYEITAVPHLGYKLVSVPDCLFPREIQHQLKTKIIGQQLKYYTTVASTMDEAFECARQEASEGTVVLAESQTKGRGRLGREWASPKGKGIYLSVVLRPKLNPSDVAKVTLMTGVALCEAINEATGIETQIKWPNDILYKGKKVAGVLTEMNAEMDRVHFCVLGLGLNVNTTAKQIPEHATSLRIISGKSIDRILLTRQILETLEHWYVHLECKEFDAIFKRWKELSFTLGQKVRIGDVEGDAIDLDEYGALLIKKSNGEVVKQLSGDVRYI